MSAPPKAANSNEEFLSVDGPILRELNRSPHPYHRQQIRLQESARTSGVSTPANRSPLQTVRNTDDEASPEDVDGHKSSQDVRYSTGSESGTEADDEHFLKGLPAPRSRPHKGLRSDSGLSVRTASPLPSPALLDQYGEVLPKYRAKTGRVADASMTSEDIRNAEDKFRRKRKLEITRRSTEVCLLAFVGFILLRQQDVRYIIHQVQEGKLR
jgi:hypothetical protein